LITIGKGKTDQMAHGETSNKVRSWCDSFSYCELSNAKYSFPDIPFVDIAFVDIAFVAMVCGRVAICGVWKVSRKNCAIKIAPRSLLLTGAAASLAVRQEKREIIFLHFKGTHEQILHVVTRYTADSPNHIEHASCRRARCLHGG
jgi:hypothetical protein